jgi:DNA-binding NarL/FixJ family response regulator
VSDARTTAKRLPAAPAQVLIVDDHPLVREGLAARLSSQPGLQVCGEAATVDEALALARAMRPALVIVDLALRNGSGLDLIKQLARERGAPRPRILVVSAYEGGLLAERALHAGAHGYINKQELQGSLLEAVRTVLGGSNYLGPELKQRFIDHAFISHRPARSGIEALSDRELQVFQLIGAGKSTRAIARQLHVSIHTVESHREKIRLKLNLHDGSELLQAAIEWARESFR